MAMTETQRTTLYSQLTDAIGQEAARTLMEQLPPSGWDQVATKDDVKASEMLLQRELKASEMLLQRELKASEKMLQRELKASEKMLHGELKETEGRLMAQIAASELRQGTRIDETNRELSKLTVEVHTGFAELQLTLAKHTRWMAAVLLGFAVSMSVPLTIALL